MGLTKLMRCFLKFFFALTSKIKELCFQTGAWERDGIEDFQTTQLLQSRPQAGLYAAVASPLIFHLAEDSRYPSH